MNRVVLFILILAGMVSCKQQEVLEYETADRVYFEYKYYNSIGSEIKRDSIVFSFGKLLPGVESDTAKIAVRFVGRLSGQVRSYRVSVADSGVLLKGKTTMTEGVDYEMFSPVQVFRANSFTDTLRIVVSRKNLDPSNVRRNSKTLMLRMENSDDFSNGFWEGQEMKLSVNDYLVEPAWWRSNMAYLNFYHSEKWRLLISWDARFVVEDALTVTLPEVITYGRVLNNYLYDNVVIDEETGKRIYMDGLYPVE